MFSPFRIISPPAGPLLSLFLTLFLLAQPAWAANFFASSTAQTGAPFRVYFSGMVWAGERAAFALPGTDVPVTGEFNSEATLRTSPTMLSAPFAPGRYEVLHLLADGTVAARLPVNVVPARASLYAASQSRAGAPFSVSWSGPGGAADFIAFATEEMTASEFAGTETVEVRRNPVVITAPAEPGVYQLRYVQRAVGLDFVLARVSVTVR